MNMNPNGTPQTSRWYDQVRAFTEAMGQPVGKDLTGLEVVAKKADEMAETEGREAAMAYFQSEGYSEEALQEMVDLGRLRTRLMEEEFAEFNDAEDTKNLTKELADLIYVAIGYAVTFGLPLVEVFERVHQSNMSKLGEDGKPIYREDGKVMKGPNYQPPKLDDLF